MVKSDKVEISILNIVFLIIFNIGMGGALSAIFNFGNMFFNSIWLIVGVIGNFFLISTGGGK